MKKTILSFSLIISVIFGSAVSVSAQNGQVQKHNGAVNFLVMGDWGRVGEDHQKPVAVQMGKIAKEAGTDFIITTGDNFYPRGVESERDPLWKYSFEDIYTAFSLQWDWYPVLGNHDYGGNPDAQVAYSKISRRWKMPARYYSKTFAIHGDTTKQVLIAFIDTNPLIPEFHTSEVYKHSVTGQDSTAQKQWLEKLLANNSPNIKWKLVVGHHPLFTATEKRRESYDTRAIRATLKPLLDKYKVDAYICGHDHDLQHLLPEGKTNYFVSGSASEATEIGKLPISKLALSDYGFMLFSATEKKLYVQVINENGNVVYATELSK
ncbi:Calcineurin-like phosphoesterase [Pseudarcicella hirudinis]|uniref:acid phosphatase n=1 Tax=Pseudarcicella hirudinis TaxID=1079859 RepID=A0A1I5VFW4_9BACT|nr:tartrate-resistant acid phosphatase type 5 family protein [Pseudarcicella hirudinis]SFQ06375.1 Calcineurin-like phosphoesterase [Pseudarcicella hirudinis]